MSQRDEPLDVLVRTKNSERLLRECLKAICDEIPVRRIIVVDAGSVDNTLEIASSFPNVEVFNKPELNLGQATKFGFSVAKTEWLAVIDSDIVLRKGWFNELKRHMSEAEAVEGQRIDHYLFDVKVDATNSRFARFGQTLIKREPVLHMDLDLPFEEDTVIKFNLEKEGKKWKKVPNFLADHYTKVDNSQQVRTGIIFRPYPHIIHIPKNLQIQRGHIIRRHTNFTSKEAIKALIWPTIYEAYFTFKRSFWFTLAYFRLI